MSAKIIPCLSVSLNVLCERITLLRDQLSSPYYPAFAFVTLVMSIFAINMTFVEDQVGFITPLQAQRSLKFGWGQGNLGFVYGLLGLSIFD